MWPTQLAFNRLVTAEAARQSLIRAEFCLDFANI